MKAYVFPGQGAQFVGMGKDLYENSELGKELFDKANEILGFNITELMFNGTDEDLRQTNVTQPAIFLHSVILAKTLGADFKPEMVAGHSLGEFSALVANGTLSFEDGLKLVSQRAMAMQKACEMEPSTMAAIIGLDDETVVKVCAEIDEIVVPANFNCPGQLVSQRAMAMQKACEIEPSTMAAIIGLDDETVERICAEIEEIVVPANFNCPGQLVISGSMKGIEIACEKLKEAGAKRALPLKVGGAFHSPLMEPARVELEEAIKNTHFSAPTCPVYQNVNAKPIMDPEEIKKNLVAQLTAPVRFTQIMMNMIADGASSFTEVGPGKVIQGLVKKVDRKMETAGVDSYQA